jgi:hypothetical protein
VPLFIIAAAPFVGRAIVSVIEAARTSRKKQTLAGWIPRVSAWFNDSCASFEQTDRLWRVHLVSVVHFLAIGALLLAPRPASAKFAATYDPAHYPEKAIPVLLGPETHRIFTNDQWGDYLIYRLYPTRNVFIDGRSDFYGDVFCQNYLDIINVKYGWDKTLDNYGIDTVVLSTQQPLAGALKLSRDWRVVHDDGTAVVFHRVASIPSRLPVSLASSDEGKTRDRVITKLSPVIAGSHNPQPKGHQL